MKRGMDWLFSSIGIAVLFIPGLLLAFLIFMTDGHSPFFVQTRVGRGKRPFGLIKFRSMYINTEKHGQLTVGHDSRITPIGRVIRKYKMDELPQLINVWKGDMSLVGPRPEVPKYVNLYTQAQQEVLSVRPGITDWASLQYFDESQLLATSDDPERTYVEEIMPAKLAINLKYIRNQHVREDLKIVWMTLMRIIKK